MLIAATVMLARLDVGAFRKRAGDPPFAEKVGLAADA